MYSQKVTVTNSIGFGVRPANIFVKIAAEFSATIHVKYNGSLANGKSYLGLLSRSIPSGGEIEIIADGKDEIKAVENLVHLVESNFTDY